MSILITDGKIFYQNELVDMDIFVGDDGKTVIASSIDVESDNVVDGVGCIVIPSLINPYIKNYVEDTIIDSSIKGGYSTNCLASSNAKADLEMTKFKFINNAVVFTDDLGYISNGKCFGYLGNALNEEVIKVLEENEAMLVYTGDNLSLLKDMDIPIYVSDININSIDEIIKLKENNNDLSCGVNIEKLLNDSNVYINYLKNGIIDMIEVDEDLTLEYSFGLLYSKLVKTNKLELNDLINLLSYNPADYFGLTGGEILNFEIANFAVFDVHTSDRINKGKFKTNYSQAKCLALVVDGDIVYKED